MRKEEKRVVKPLSEKEQQETVGGYYPPTDEQLEAATGGNPLLAEIICWNTKPLGV